MTGNVPFLDLKRQYDYLSADLNAAVRRVFEKQQFIMGEEVISFEKEMADYLGVSYTVGISSGTDALLIALMALGIKPGDEVIVPSFTFFSTAGCVSRLGARPVFADIEADTFNLNATELERLINPRTRAVIPVHLFGQVANLDEISAIAEAHNIAVIEDVAQAIGAEVNECKAGTLGRLGCFSFFPAKNLGGAGDGGLVATNDSDLALKLSLLRSHGANPKYHHKIIGGNFRLDALQAAVLRTKLPYLDGWNGKRRENASKYDEAFHAAGLSVNEIITPQQINGTHVFNQYVIRTPSREDLAEHLIKAGIGIQIYYPEPLHVQPCFMAGTESPPQLRVSERVAKEVLALPIYPELKPEELRYVADMVISFFHEKS